MKKPKEAWVEKIKITYEKTIVHQEAVDEYNDKKVQKKSKFEAKLGKAFDLQDFSFADQIIEKKKHRGCVIL